MTMRVICSQPSLVTQKQLPQLQKRRNTSLWREACQVMMKKYFCHMGKNWKKPESIVNTVRVQFYQFITRPSLSNIKPVLKQRIVKRWLGAPIGEGLGEPHPVQAVFMGPTDAILSKRLETAEKTRGFVRFEVGF